ncbi:GNAT family N-acetyltransferase [Streptomyces sp. NPDC087270]|uniref:GNAT family N-acetyltransferase n=1 Tax=Streptomyces sp. NPDC087270 TaxID=3365774 RepID=UPI003821CABC
MTDRPEIAVVRWPDRGPGARPQEGPAELLAAYHLRTQAEKGEAVAAVDDLPERYRAEIADPEAAFAADVVLLALGGGAGNAGDAAVGCLVVTDPVEGGAEIKRLWTDPAYRGRGVASGLVRAALAWAARSGVGTLRLSVWEWRTDAIALYERLGFTVTASWDERERLVCMERAV